MLVPNDIEREILEVYQPWLARLRGSAHRFGDDTEKYLSLVDEAQNEILEPIRVLQELNAKRGDARLKLKYARFVLNSNEQEGLSIEGDFSYTSRMNEPRVQVPNTDVFQKLEALIRKYGHLDLLTALGDGEDQFKRKHACVARMREAIPAMYETAHYIAQSVNGARSAQGLPVENFSNVGDSDAATG